jgi:hypothetical protein
MRYELGRLEVGEGELPLRCRELAEDTGNKGHDATQLENRNS